MTVLCPLRGLVTSQATLPTLPAADGSTPHWLAVARPPPPVGHTIKSSLPFPFKPSLVRRGNIPVIPASDGSVVRISLPPLCAPSRPNRSRVRAPFHVRRDACLGT
eukprot:3979140-Pyramimonas_sp.AAC.1